MVCPTNTQGNLVTTRKFTQTAGEGSLQGRRIINTAEKINAIKEQSTNMSADSKIDVNILSVLCTTTLIVGIVASYFVFSQVPTSHKDPLIELTTACILSAGSINVGLGILYHIPSELSKYQKLKAIPENLNDEQFLNWAEYKNVELNIHNVEKYLSKYKKNIECSNNIDRLQSAVINTK
ncbi:MAG TPA: hypothetical protein VGP47_00615 [Parachlamydiaceae bacterium]|nr:hypothetical protein [Parachlamydiaceae bacterium]